MEFCLTPINLHIKSIYVLCPSYVICCQDKESDLTQIIYGLLLINNTIEIHNPSAYSQNLNIKYMMIIDIHITLLDKNLI